MTSIKKRYALESSRQGLSNSVDCLSLRCVVLEILGGGQDAAPPPIGARCSADPNGARVETVIVFINYGMPKKQRSIPKFNESRWNKMLLLEINVRCRKRAAVLSKLAQSVEIGARIS